MFGIYLITLALAIAIMLAIPVFTGAIFRVFIKTPNAGLLAILVGAVLFFFDNMLMERNGLGLVEQMTRQAVAMQKEGMPMPALVPAMLAVFEIVPSVLFPAYLAQFGIMLVDKKRKNKNTQNQRLD
jgi:hypothetical protein